MGEEGVDTGGVNGRLQHDTVCIQRSSLNSVLLKCTLHLLACRLPLRVMPADCGSNYMQVCVSYQLTMGTGT